MKTVRLNKSSTNQQLLPNITPLDSNSESQQQSNEPTNGSSSLVRRLSVTARPGDIFYKVKDVTESCSTTDTLTCETQIGQSDQNENNLLLNNVEMDEMPNAKSDQQQQQQQQGSTNGRRTTTWNSRRINQANDSNSKPLSPLANKDDANSTDLLSKTQNIPANLEPGSPMFTKELLSIR